MEEEKNTKRSVRKKKKSIVSKLIILILIIAMAILCVVYIPRFKNNDNKNELEEKIIGSWTTDGYSVYEFYENKKGALVLPIATYDFNYKIEENIISIDFENEKSIDSDYEFSFEGEKLILKGINNASGTYTFTKNEK